MRCFGAIIAENKKIAEKKDKSFGNIKTIRILRHDNNTTGRFPGNYKNKIV